VNCCTEVDFVIEFCYIFGSMVAGEWYLFVTVSSSWLCTESGIMIVTADEVSRLKRESEQLRSENMRFRSIIDNAGL